MFKQFLCFIVFAFSFQAFGADPALAWKTHETPHFLIHYPSDLEGFVSKVDYLAEQSHESLAAYFKWQPKKKTHVVLLDEVDQANGFASPIPNNTMTLYMQPPTQGELLVYDDWLKMLIHHEYTHILQIDKVLGLPAGLRKVFGRYILLFPNALHPNWFQEGLATYMETDDEKGVGRGQSDIFQMMMRQEVLAGIKPLSRINTVNPHDWPFNSAYLYGVYFFRFIEDVYGKQAINDLISNYSDNLLPYRVSTNPRLITGKTLEQLWPDFQNYLVGYFTPQINRIKSQALTNIKTLSSNHFAYGLLAKGVNNDLWYSAVDADDGVNLYHYNGGQERKVIPLNSSATVDVNTQGDVLISQLEQCGQYSQFYDLYVLKQDNLQRITQCGRYRLAKWVGHNRIIALHYDAGLAVLQSLDNTGKVLEDIWRGHPGEILSSFDVGETGQIIASIKFKQKAWNIYAFQQGQWHAVTDDEQLQTNPLLFNGSVYFVQNQIGQFEGYRVDLSQVTKSGTKKATKTRLTHSLGGIKQLVMMDDGRAMALWYTDKGYQVAQLQLSPSSELYSQQYLASEKLPEFPSKQKSDIAYNPLSSLLPTYWFPVYLSQDKLTEVGFFTSGQDALATHQYLAQITYEKQHKEPLLDFNYIYDGRWILGLQQALNTTNLSHVSEYSSQKFIAYMQPILKSENSYYPYAAYINSHTELRFNQTNNVAGIEVDDNWLALGLIYDGLRRSLNSADASGGWQWGVSLEDADGADNSHYYGQVFSFNARNYQTLSSGNTVAQRLFMGAGLSSNSPFSLGGSASDVYVGPGIQLKQRKFALRGFDTGQAKLTADNALIYSLEYRLPFTWVDHNIITPPVGFSGWSLRAFTDNGMAWYQDKSMGDVYSSIGGEVILDTTVVYNFNLRFRAGVAKGFGSLGSEAVYVQLGGAF